ncbi:bifunctional diguanylate cyclase/phosphodiesterase [Granulicella sibirica]|nr:GGDEF domain-containing protein [Granulicella sibirica]
MAEQHGSTVVLKDFLTRRIPPVLRLARLAVCLACLAVTAQLLNRQSVAMTGVSLVWLSNGFLIGVLLASRRPQWPAFILLGLFVDVMVNMVLGDPPGPALYFGLCNMVEVALGALLMYRFVAEDPDLTQVRQLGSLMFGALFASSVASALASTYISFHGGRPFTHSFRFWFAADVLGIATMTPLYISFHFRKQFSRRSPPETILLFTLLCVVALGVFRMTNYPMLWFVLLFLLLLGVRLGFTASAAGLLAVTFIGGYLTTEGFGPLGRTFIGPLEAPVLIFQTFVALSMVALYTTEAAMSVNQRVMSKLSASESRFRSLAEASRDVIVLTDIQGRRKYVSPAVTEMLGWLPDELVGRNDLSTVHSDDVPKMIEMVRALRNGDQPSPLAYQALKKDGEYRWLESNSRLLLDDDTGEPSGFVFVVRDISDRRAAEEKMQEAFRAVELQAMRDGLTGVANRRLLDQTLRSNWQRGARDHTPLSLLLIDVDQFKAYNDLYGHLAGDECLRRIAEAIQTVLRRPQDLLARYGGEEFVAVLPSTSGPGAELISEIFRKTIEDLAIAHDVSPHGVVTVSLGCATVIPSIDKGENSLIQSADAALYRAKTTGRNRTRVAGDEFVIN